MVRKGNHLVVEDRLGTVNGPSTNPYGDGQVYEGYGFTGYYHDGTTGLDYAQQRYYASSLGRFTTPDPYMPSAAIARPQSWNRYAYVENDPVNFVDPSGLWKHVPESPPGLDPLGLMLIGSWQAQMQQEMALLFLAHPVGGKSATPRYPGQVEARKALGDEKCAKAVGATSSADAQKRMDAVAFSYGNAGGSLGELVVDVTDAGKVLAHESGVLAQSWTDPSTKIDYIELNRNVNWYFPDSSVARNLLKKAPRQR